MFRGFNLTVSDNTFASQYIDEGSTLHSSQKEVVRSTLKSFLDADGNLSASRMTARWFPTIPAQVFISHSHRDSKLAIGLAGCLKTEFGLTSFIDSCAWGYSSDLLKMIDNEYCYQPDTETYSYSRRNRSTSHVHMMPTVALIKMINECECLIFVNTPAAISPRDYVSGNTTESPWIYSEIAMTSLIQKRAPSSHRYFAKAAAALDEAMRILYEVDLTHLSELRWKDLNDWKRACGTAGGNEALDVLYDMIT
jgi:hypothetical protein